MAPCYAWIFQSQSYNFAISISLRCSLKCPADNHQLAQLPERLSFSTVRVESPLGKAAPIPRRELFDVRLQLLQDVSTDNDRVIDQIEKSDLRSGVYEGGFKTWECSVDLASLLLDRGPRKDIDELALCDQIVEVSHHLFLSRALQLTAI